MDKFLELFPDSINTGILVGGMVVLYKAITFINTSLKKKKESQKIFAEGVLEKERERSKFEARLTETEKELVKIRQDFDKKNLENKEEFLILTKKLDKILDILLKPINQK